LKELGLGWKRGSGFEEEGRLSRGNSTGVDTSNSWEWSWEAGNCTEKKHGKLSQRRNKKPAYTRYTYRQCRPTLYPCQPAFTPPPPPHPHTVAGTRVSACDGSAQRAAPAPPPAAHTPLCNACPMAFVHLALPLHTASNFMAHVTHTLFIVFASCHLVGPDDGPVVRSASGGILCQTVPV